MPGVQDSAAGRGAEHQRALHELRHRDGHPEQQVGGPLDRPRRRLFLRSLVKRRTINQDPHFCHIPPIRLLNVCCMRFPPDTVFVQKGIPEPFMLDPIHPLIHI